MSPVVNKIEKIFLYLNCTSIDVRGVILPNISDTFMNKNKDIKSKYVFNGCTKKTDLSVAPSGV